jgi:alpha-mannosidase
MWVEATVPSCGWTTLYPAGASEPTNTLKATPRLLENDVVRLTLDDQGTITSILDKESGRELAAGPCNNLRIYRDVPSSFDAWDIDSMYPLTPVELDEPASTEVVAAGPLVARLRVTRRLHDSTLTQEISLRRGSRRVDFHTVVDWQESHKLLKVDFPVTVHANEGVHEIQFGHIRRPNHKSRPFDADRFEVCNHKWTALMEENRGCAVLNDSKYGVNVAGNSINLTLLKSALAPDMSADRGRQEFTYAFYAWNGPFAGSPVVREAYELNRAVMTAPGAARERSLFAVDAPNVVIETVKPAEDGSPDVVVRAYEAKRTATRCTLATSLPVVGAAQTDMLENVQRELPCQDDKVALEFRPFEVKTVRLRMAS